MSVSVIIPAYNESSSACRSRCAETVCLLRPPEREPFEILVVDDGSSGQTPPQVLLRSSPRSHGSQPRCIRQSNASSYGGNRGKGCAVRFGMLRAQAATWRLFCDADLATPVEEYDLVLTAMDA